MKTVYKRKSKQCIQKNEEIRPYEVNGIYSSGEGLELTIGDKCVILEQLQDVALIERIGDDNNPYIIPLSVLQEIVDLE